MGKQRFESGSQHVNGDDRASSLRLPSGRTSDFRPTPGMTGGVSFETTSGTRYFFFAGFAEALARFFSSTLVRPGRTVTSPPAFSIFSLADALNR